MAKRAKPNRNSKKRKAQNTNRTKNTKIMGMMDGAAGAVLGFVGDQYTNGQNQSFAERQGKKQYQRQRALNQQGKDLSLEMWNDTNYEAQMKHMMNAGLNPNTIYGGSGAGGATASTGSGGSAPSVQATSQSGGLQAGIGQMSQMAMMKTQQDLMKAQKDNVEANTNKTNIEASNIEEPITAGVSKTLAERDKTNIENEITGDTREEEKQRIRAEANKTTGEATSAMVKGDIDTETRPQAIMYIKGQVMSQKLEQALTEARTGASLQEVQNMKQAVRKMQAEISQGWEKLSQSEREVQIKKIEQELKAMYPNLGQVWGGKINEALRDIDENLGQDGGNYYNGKKK